MILKFLLKTPLTSKYVLKFLTLKVKDTESWSHVIGDVTEAITQVPTRYFYENGNGGGDATLPNFKAWEKLHYTDFTPGEAYANWLRDTKGIHVSAMSKYYDNIGKPTLEHRGADMVRVTTIRDKQLLSDALHKF